MAPFVPAGMIAEFVTTCPWNVFRIEALGLGCPVGQAVTNGIGLPFGVAVTLIA